MAGEVGGLAGVLAASVGGGTVGDRPGRVLPGALGDGRRARKKVGVLLRPATGWLALLQRLTNVRGESHFRER